MINSSTRPMMQHATLDLKGNLNISWHYTDEEITFTVAARTTGWLALGFSPNGDMINSDMAVVEHLRDGNPVLTVSVTKPTGKLLGINPWA